MKALKIILAILAAVVVILAIAGYYVFKNFDSLAKTAIEDIGSDLTQTEVRVDTVAFKLTQGRGDIGGLTIANVDGFEQPNLFTLGHIGLQVDPATLRDPVIVINEILIDGAKLTLEHKGLTATNVQQLLDNIRAQTGSGEPEAETDSGRELRFMVKSLQFTDLGMDVVSPQIDNRTLALPDIARSNLGTPETGLTSRELGLAIVQPLIDAARAKFEAELKGRVGDKVQEALDRNLSDEDRAKIDKLKSLLR